MYFCVFIKASLCRVSYFVFNPEKPALPTVTKSHKAEIPGWRYFVYSRKDEISAWKFKKLLKIMLCLGAMGLGTPCSGSSGVRGLMYFLFVIVCLSVTVQSIAWKDSSLK